MRGHNEGSIKLRSDGRYEVRVTAGIDFATGKTKRISYYAKTKAEAIKILHQAEYDIHFHDHIDPTSITLADWLELWLHTYMKNRLKQSTYVSYRGYITNHFIPAIGSVKLKEVTSKLLQDFYNYKLEHGLSPKTILNLNLCLHKALKQAVLDKYLSFNPCDAVTLPRNEKPQIEVLTREEQYQLMQTSYHFRYGVFIRLTLATGLRMGELLGLKWEDIDLRSGMLQVRRTLNRLTKMEQDSSGSSTEIVFQTPKSKNSIRSIPLMKPIVEELKQWQTVQKQDADLAGTAYQNLGMVVSNPLGMYIEPRTFKDYYDQILKASGIGHFTFHALRHTFATRALEQKMDSKTLSTILGHYSVSFTLDTYAHVLDNHKREGMQLMEELFQPQVPTVSVYSVIAAPSGSGFLLTAVDFEESVFCLSIEQGLTEIQHQIRQNLLLSAPPVPTPCADVAIPNGAFLVMVTI